MRHVSIDVLSPSRLLPLAEVQRAVRALERQVRRDLSPVWNVEADLRVVGPRARPRKGAWQLALLDVEDSSYDGYHELTAHGLPLGKVDLRTAMKTSTTGWTSTASHELLEMLVNADTQQSVLLHDEAVGTRVYALEICDPCQDDPFCYRVDDVWVSDFVYPEWFQPWHAPRSTRFDHARKLVRPLHVAPGGYASFYDARGRRWLEDDGRRGTSKLQPADGYASRGGSRRLLRALPRSKWRRSGAQIIERDPRSGARTP